MVTRSTFFETTATGRTAPARSQPGMTPNVHGLRGHAVGSRGTAAARFVANTPATVSVGCFPATDDELMINAPFPTGMIHVGDDTRSRGEENLRRRQTNFGSYAL
jgi:hypothetical protein